MNELSRVQAHHTIESCESIEEVKAMARALLECHYAARQMIAHMIAEGLPKGVATFLQDNEP